jgi:uncharacterized cupin superfamily protein
MPKIDIDAVPKRLGSGYPPPFTAPCADRARQRLGDAGGLSDFGVNLMQLPSGNWSSQRHWHSHEDEFVYVLEGELTLIEDGGETVLRAGDCAAFPKNSGNGHHMINRSEAMAIYLEVGSRSPADLTTCSDIDMMSSNADGRSCTRMASHTSSRRVLRRPLGVVSGRSLGGGQPPLQRWSASPHRAAHLFRQVTGATRVLLVIGSLDG